MIYFGTAGSAAITLNPDGSVSITSSGPSNGIFASVSWSGNVTLGTVTYGGTALTKVIQQDNSTNHASLWYLANSGVGAQFLRGVWSANVTEAAIQGVVLIGVDQTTTVEGSMSASATGTVTTAVGTTTTNNAWLIDSVWNASPTVAVTPESGVVQRVFQQDNDTHVTSTKQVATAGSVNMRSDFDASTAWAQAVAFVKPATSTKLYLQNANATYEPPTERGAWDVTNSFVAKQLQTANSGAFGSVLGTETSATTNQDILLYKGVTPPLSGAHTLNSGIYLVIGDGESAAGMNAFWHVHSYVTQGDTDTPRGTLLADYTESTTFEWPTTPAGDTLGTPQPFTSVSASDQDRIVFELGCRAANTVTTSFNSRIYYGGTGSDLTDGGDENTAVGFIEVFQSLTFGTASGGGATDPVGWQALSGVGN